jgi:hypothetical protein
MEKLIATIRHGFAKPMMPQIPQHKLASSSQVVHKPALSALSSAKCRALFDRKVNFCFSSVRFDPGIPEYSDLKHPEVSIA